MAACKGGLLSRRTRKLCSRWAREELAAEEEEGGRKRGGVGGRDGVEEGCFVVSFWRWVAR